MSPPPPFLRVITSVARHDYDAGGNLVCIDIDNASTKVALDQLIVSSMPGTVVMDAA